VVKVEVNKNMKITKISADIPHNKKLRVAAYARVSDGKDAMLRSLSAQVGYYSGYIQSRNDWQYAGVFADEAATGTTDERSGFQRMLDECRAGNIDMIITKSVSRFARNTVITLETVRELRQLGISVYFERENINTLSGDGELLLSLLASFSQEESRNVSENVKWYYKKKFENGELAGFRFMYGYDIKRGEVEINEEQAAVVRRIFSMYLDGMGTTAISDTLRNENIRGIRGGEFVPHSISALLRNEKYTGNALFQKKYVTDHLTKKLVLNKGERPQYYAENTHPAIINKADFDAVQERLRVSGEKYNSTGNHTNRYVFTKIIICEQCGKHYRRRIVACKPWWVCGSVVKYGRSACSSSRVSEHTLITAVVGVLGLPSFDESVFIEEVENIISAGQNTLWFIFKDGIEIAYKWENPSRRESWTPEMRKTASERQKEIEQTKKLRKEGDK
jgi:DNA invertase Pin-like site-specific DNA recombinase